NSSTALARATYNPLAQDVAWFLDPSTQGTKTVSAEFRDAAGNTASVLTASTIYDTVAPSPVTLAIVGGLTTTNDAGVPLSLSAVDTNGLSATAGLTLSEDLSFQGAVVGPSAMPGSGLVTFPLPPGDGVRRIYARFRDIAGNDATASVTVTLDTVAPTGSIEAFGVLADGTPSTTRSSSTGITVNVTATGATGYLLGYDSLSTCPTAAASYAAVPVVTTGLAATLTSTPGTRLVKLCLRDAAGNLAGPFTDSLVLDGTAPTGCTLALSGTMADGLTAAPAGQTARSQVTATVASCSSDVAEYVIAGGTVACSPTMVANWVPFSGPSTAQAFLLTGGEGTNTVSGCYRDASRNVASLSAATISLDTTPPSALGITLNGGAAFLGQAQLVSGQPTVTIAGSAVGATQWAFAESNPTTYASYTGASGSLTLGGAGLRTVYARFRDDLGNLSSVVSATITVDTTPPSTAGAAFRIDTPDGGAYVSSNSVTLLMTPPSDATQQQVVERSAAGACAVGDYASAVTTPVATSAVFLLSSSPGAKRVCIRWFDAASNPSASLVDTKTLDTAAPSQPFILASDRVFNPNTTGEASGSWISIVNTVDPQHFDWQVLGGQANQWTSTPAAAPSGSTPGCTAGLCLRALLSTSASAEAGTQNTIRLREVDAAGNASAEASIVLTTDIVPPRPVALSSFWVDNRSTSAVVRWQPRDGGSPDTVGHYIYYSAAPGYPGDGGTAPPLDYIGINASEGPSPILVGNTNSATLSSLANGGLTYVTVRPVDRAGNLGASAQSTPEVVLQPNEVSPTHIGTLSLGITLGPGLDAGVLTGSPYATSVEVIGETAYVYGGWWTGYSSITPVALGGIVSPSQGGAVGTGTLPTVLTTVYSADGQTFSGRPGAMVAEPPYLFTAAGNFFRVWSIAKSPVPELVTSIDLSAYLTGPLHLNALDVRGPIAFAIGFNSNEILFHLDLAQLYDNDASTNSIVVRSA
ncbi:MAG: hypothetical protein JNG84_11395, partial [Archangium sp.]|nr:hypothetical protein [Archangium sp.]